MSSLLPILTAALLTLQGPDVASGPHLSVSSVPFGPDLDKIGLRVRGGETSASQTLYLRQTGDQPLTDVRLFLIVEGRPAAVSFGNGSGEKWSVPAHGAETEVKLTWTDVIPSGSVDGELIATVAGGQHPIAKVKVTKDTEPPLHLLEATSGGIKLTGASTAFLHTFHIMSLVDHEIEGVQIVVEPLVDSTSEQAMPRIEVDGSSYDGSATLRIPGRTTKPFVLRTDLVRAGVHKGNLALRWAGGEETVTLELTRTQVAASVEVNDIANIRITLGEGDAAHLRVALRETDGRNVNLAKPTLLALLQKIGTDEVQVGEATLEVNWEDESLGPHENRIVQLTVGGLRAPGEYSSTFRFSAGDGPPIDKSAKIFVRRNAWVAALLIVAGTLASFLLRWFLIVRKLQLVSQREAIDLHDDLERIAASFESLGEVESQMVQSLRDRIAVLFREATTDTKTAVKAGLDEVDRKLPILVEWLRIRTSFGGRAIPHDVRAKLLEVEQFLRRQDATANAAAAQRTVLQDLGKTIASLPTVQAAIESLREEIAQQTGITMTPSELSGVRAPLDQAAAAAKEGQPDEAAAKLQKAQEAWRKVLFSDFEKILASTETPGIDPGEWQLLAASASKHLTAAQTATDHDEAISEYQAGLGIVLDGMTRGLQKTVSELAQQFPPTDQLENLETEVASLQDDLRQDYDAKQLAGIQSRYSKAVEDLRVEIESIKSGTQQFAAVIPHKLVMRAPSILPDEVFVVQPVDVETSRRFSRSWVSFQIYIGEFLVTGVLLAIALFMGLQLLYYPNVIWGSPTDCVTALLWGLGLHEVGNTSFQGLRGLRATFAAPPTT